MDVVGGRFTRFASGVATGSMRVRGQNGEIVTITSSRVDDVAFRLDDEAYRDRSLGEIYEGYAESLKAKIGGE